MDLNELKKLKSGTDVRGIASGENITLTDRAVENIAAAFIVWLDGKYHKGSYTVAVGNDSRISAPRLKAAVSRAVTDCGSSVVYTGLSSTPSMFILLKKLAPEIDASIMITASHLPSNRNGLKFFTREGSLDGRDIDEILGIAAEGNFPKGKGSYREQSFMDSYSALLVNIVKKGAGEDLPLKGRKIIVDAGNGAGGFFAEKVLKPLGADTDGSLYLEPDGTFPHHIPNPEDEGAIKCLADQVIKKGADLGIIFDTDVDRAGAVDRDGKEINRNRLIALLAAMLDKKGVIVTDSVTSDHLTKFIEDLGFEHLRYMRGYKNVINKCREINENGGRSPLAIETSGHAAYADNYYLDDGAYLITRILICLSKQAKNNEGISELIKNLGEPKESAEVRISFNENSVDFKAEGAFVIERLKDVSDPDFKLAPQNYEGARFNSGDGWTLIRISVHDPVMPINFESDSVGGNKIMAEKLYGYLKNFNFLDLSNLEKFITCEDKHI